MNRSFGARRTFAVLLLGGLAAFAVSITRAARIERADLVMNNGTEVSTLDPAQATGVPESRVMYSLYEGLTVKHPKTLAPLPGMAESWEISEDGRTYTFHVRPDAKWSNGDPLTAHDFEWSWKRVLRPETASEYAYQLWYLVGGRESTRMPDDRWFGDMTEGVWVRELENGRLRIGLHGFFLALDREPTDTAQVLVEEGGALESLQRAFVRVANGPGYRDGRDHSAHVLGRVTAVNEALPRTVGELLVDPYEERWMIELEPEPGSLDAAVEAGHLVDARVARETIFEPLLGAKAVDDRTFVVTLSSPTPFFIYLVSFYPTFPVHRPTFEWARATFPDTWQIEWIRPENIVTNGPYRLVERRINDRLRLAKSEMYWDAENVAMRTIDILAVEHYGTMLNLYLTGEVDWVDRCAPNLIPRMMGREDFNPESYLGTYFYRVNVTKPPLDDVRVRRALALTIDRRSICEKITKKGEQPLWSLCPGGMPGYDVPEMRHAPVAKDLSNYDEAFTADCAEAARLLADAGYGPGGKEFPTIEIHYNTAEIHRDLAEVVADTWKRVLDVDAKLLNQEWKVYLDTQNTIAYDVSRSAWIGDYPDPNTFVDLFLTGGENNRTGWGNPRYDELVRGAAFEPDPRRRLDMLAEAEAILLEELPILPIYSYVTQNVVNPRLGGFFENVQDDHYPKFFYWMSDEELAEKRGQQPDDWRHADAPGPSEGLYSPRAQRERAR